MKPPEILSLLEEAAGTRMYEKKKEAAQRTLAKKQSKLEQIDSVGALREQSVSQYSSQCVQCLVCIVASVFALAASEVWSGQLPTGCCYQYVWLPGVSAPAQGVSRQNGHGRPLFHIAKPSQCQ